MNFWVRFGSNPKLIHLQLARPSNPVEGEWLSERAAQVVELASGAGDSVHKQSNEQAVLAFSFNRCLNFIIFVQICEYVDNSLISVIKQFIPGSSSEVLITSADSRIRVIDGNNLVYKFKGFRNTSSQICAYPTTTGKHVICASEDSNVYIWRYDADTRPSRSNSVSQSYEHFHCLGVTVAVPWPNASSRLEGISLSLEVKEDNCICISNRKNNSDMIVEASGQYSSLSPEFRYIDLNTRSGPFGDRVSGTWPKEKLNSSSGKNSAHSSGDLSNGDSVLQSRLAWGMVIVTASRGGVIRIYQNYGLPVRV
ncbi:uncharacterized protein LOC110101398 [Dendrobium catenatum]|nr:uncharacterized protein LOC110101398 [Dendrobium catenatum]